MDAYSREIAQQALDRAMENRTAIIIADKLSTIRKCELIYVMNEGQVVESGTFEDLFEDQASYFNKLRQAMEEFWI